MKYAFFQELLTADGLATVSEIVDAPRTQDGVTFQLHELYHPSIVKAARPCGEDVEIGATFNYITGEFLNPPLATTLDGDEDEDDTGNGNPPPTGP